MHFPIVNSRKKVLRIAAIFLLPLTLIFSQCFNSENKTTNDPRGDLYAGSASCVKCHKDISHSFLNTAYYFSSRPASLKNIHGSFNKDSNTVVYNDSLKVVMEKLHSGLYQSAYLNGKKINSQPFDLVFGNSKAETYIFWKNNEPHELPISYFENLHSWTISPGYESNEVDYTRPIISPPFLSLSTLI